MSAGAFVSFLAGVNGREWCCCSLGAVEVFGSNERCPREAEVLLARGLDLTEAIWGLEMPTIQNQVAWYSDCPPERLLPLSLSPLSVQRNSQTGWLVRRALWLYYIVNFGTALTLTAFPWLIEPLKRTPIIFTQFLGFKVGSQILPQGTSSIFLNWKGYCERNNPPLLSLKYVLQSDFYLLLHSFTASHFPVSTLKTCIQ